MWSQTYSPFAGHLGLSALAAALPLFVLLYLLGIRRTTAWVAGVSGLAAAVAVALILYRMPVSMVVSASALGAAFGLLPITWIVFWAIFLYRLVVDTGRFEVVKDSVGSLTQDRRLQANTLAVDPVGLVKHRGLPDNAIHQIGLPLIRIVEEGEVDLDRLHGLGREISIIECTKDRLATHNEDGRVTG